MIKIKLTTNDEYYLTEEQYQEWNRQSLINRMVPIHGLQVKSGDKFVDVDDEINMSMIVLAKKVK